MKKFKVILLDHADAKVHLFTVEVASPKSPQDNDVPEAVEAWCDDKRIKFGDCSWMSKLDNGGPLQVFIH